MMFIMSCKKDLQNEAVKTEPIKLEPYCDHTINSKEIDTIFIDSDSPQPKVIYK